MELATTHQNPFKNTLFSQKVSIFINRITIKILRSYANTPNIAKAASKVILTDSLDRSDFESIIEICFVDKYVIY